MVGIDFVLCLWFFYVVGVLVVIVVFGQRVSDFNMVCFVVLLGVFFGCVLSLCVGDVFVGFLFNGCVCSISLWNWFRVGVGLLLLGYVMVAYAYFRQRLFFFSEFYFFVLLFYISVVFMVGNLHLVVFYLVLELQNFCIYSLLSLRGLSEYSVEVGLKYFVFSSLISGVCLFGISLLYGVFGGLRLVDILLVFDFFSLGFVGLVGFGLLLSLLVFKLGLFPLHGWLYDVFRGTPTVVVLFFLLPTKVSILGFVLSVLQLCLFKFGLLFVVCGFMSVFVGLFLGLLEERVKILFGFSGMLHLGLMVCGLGVLSFEGMGAVLGYLFVYGLLMLFVFVFFVLLVCVPYFVRLRFIWDLVGLGWTNLGLGLFCSFFLFSLAGLPPLPGFFVKFKILSVVFEAGWFLLCVLCLVLSTVSCFYYLRVVRLMFFDGVVDRIVCGEVGVSVTLCVVLGCSFLVSLFFWGLMGFLDVCFYGLFVESFFVGL